MTTEAEITTDAGMTLEKKITNTYTKSFKKLYQFKDCIFSQYEIINASGGKAGDDLSDEVLSDNIFAKNKQDIINKIKKVNNGKINKAGTITLTCRKFLTGVTIKQWNSILILNNTESAESYFQAIFRIQSAWYKNNKVLKPTGFVFDFAISRCLRTTYDYADALTDQLDQQDSQHKKHDKDNLKKVVDGLCETLDIKQFYEGSIRLHMLLKQKTLNFLKLLQA